jgi:hypothetical protein
MGRWRGAVGGRRGLTAPCPPAEGPLWVGLGCSGRAGRATAAWSGEPTFRRVSLGRKDRFRPQLLTTRHPCDHGASLRVPSSWTATVQARAR